MSTKNGTHHKLIWVLNTKFIKLIKICDQWDLGFVNTKINNSFGLGNLTSELKRYKINEQPIHFYLHKDDH